MKKGTLEQWQELGMLCKEAHNLLLEICVKADQIMPKKDWGEAGKAQNASSAFKSHAEDVMYAQLGKQGGARTDVFYGPYTHEEAAA